MAKRKGKRKKTKRDEERVGRHGRNYRKSERVEEGFERKRESEQETDAWFTLPLIGITARYRGSNHARRRAPVNREMARKNRREKAEQGS